MIKIFASLILACWMISPLGAVPARAEGGGAEALQPAATSPAAPSCLVLKSVSTQPLFGSPGDLEFCHVECTHCGQAGCNDCAPDPENLGCWMCRDCPWPPWG